jgi:O-succinylbenzoic acid--CoA ligase
MKYGLLNYLKSSNNQDWLWCYENDRNQELNNDQNSTRSSNRYSNRQLEQLIDAQVELISTLVAEYSQGKATKLAIFIVEPKPINFITAFLAGVITGVDVFLCDPAWQLQEWQQVLNLVQPDLIFGDDQLKSSIKSLSAERNSRQQNALNLDHQAECSNRPLMMIPTGGTSGKIKFAMHSWETLTASVRGFQDFFDCQKINSVCTLPLYHVSGLMQLMRSLLTQGNLVICPYQSIATQLSHFNKSDYFISLVPTQLKFLLESTPNCLQEFKTVLVGGAPSRRSLLNTAREYQIAIALTYGMTETASGVVALKPQDFLAGNNSSGQVLPQAQIKIVNPEAELQPEKPKSSTEQPGLIQINSTSLCLGYYPQVFPVPQSFLTDDVGYCDRDGYLHLLGRNSQKIITGGEKVFPEEVEAVIYATRLVQDICVVGIPDQKWGEAVTAVYVPLKAARDFNLNLIKQQVRSQLAKYKQPKYWLEVDRIPHNDRGKVDHQQLKAIALQASKST